MSRTLLAAAPYLLALVVFGLAGGPVSRAAPIEPAALLPFDDVELTSCSFVGRQFGWIVGGQGAVWHTSDGGDSWRRQASGVACRLRSVHFVDERNGWVVGGDYGPYGSGGRGVVLRTLDGGATWRREVTPLLPALRQVRFRSLQEGWAVGETSTFSPAGLFLTRDGGRTWNGAAGNAPTGLLAAEFITPHSGWAATAGGDVVAIDGRTVREAPAAQFGLRAARRIAIREDGRGWLVGDGGLLHATVDGGATWQPVNDPLVAALSTGCDWRALAIAGSHVWIVGSPGSVVLHSPDDGGTWQRQTTGQPLPLADVVFADDKRGWAVGALGTVLRTDDGGATWQNAVKAVPRAALWTCFAEARDLPLELLSQAVGDGYRTAACTFGRREFDVTSGNRETTADREADALARLGVSYADRAWAFPLRQRLLRADPLTWLHAWEGANDADALRRATGYLVRELRTWRPDVVLTHTPSPRGDMPTEQLIHDLVLRACEWAADPAQFPEQLEQAGLAAWQVKRVFTHAAGQTRGTTTIATVEVDVRRGASPADLTAACRARLFAGEIPPPPQVAARLVVNRTSSPAGDRGLCAGLGIAAPSDARRAVTPPSTEALLQARQIAERRRNLLAIATRTAKSDEDVVAQVRDMAIGMIDERAALAVFQFAESFRLAGRYEAARKTYEFLVTRYPDESPSEVALRRLIHHLSSGEIDWQLQRALAARAATASDVPTAVTEVAPPPPVVLGQVTVEAPRPVQLVSATPNVPIPGIAAPSAAPTPATAAMIGFANDAARRERCIGLAAYFERRDPARFADPAIGFAVASARRKLGQAPEAEAFYDAFFRNHAADAWWEWAGAENARSNRPAASFKRRHRSARAPQPPRLDGRLDDAMWQGAEPIVLRSPLGEDDAWPAAAFLAHDDEHLYLAVRCRRVPGDDLPAPTGPRTRDTDLSSHDRVDFCFDVDRDLATYYRLSVDRRGWTAESLWDDATWNPQWYVAAAGDEQTWIVEAAIPWSELVARPPTSGEAWACGIQRLAPTAGLQSWTTPADIDIRPEGFGLIVFE